MRKAHGRFLRLVCMGMLWAALPISAWAQANWFDIGLGYLREKQYADAEKAFTQVIEIVPYDNEAFNNRGVTRMFQGDLKGALQDFNRALKIDPAYRDALYNRALVRTRQERFDLALVDLDQLLLVNPESARGFNQRGFVKTKQADLKGAVADYEEALRLRPQWVEVHNNIAWLLATCPDARVRNGSRAVTLALKAVDLNPSADYYATLAAAYAEKGDFGAAIAAQQKVRTLLAGDETESQEIASRERIALFRAGKPLREDYTKVAPKPAASPKKVQGTKKALARLDTTTAVRIATRPYAIQAAIYNDPEKAFEIARELIGKGYVAYTAPSLIEGQHRWVRVLVGRYTDTRATETMLNRLIQDGFMRAHVVEMPYCLGLESQLSATDLVALGRKMKAHGIQTFRLGQDQEKLLMAGAFKDPQLAKAVAAELTTEGIACRVAKP